MNLGKAKTVLIICFLLLNIFLGYRLHERMKRITQGINPDPMQWQQLEVSLAEKGLILEAAPPAEVKTAALLKVFSPIEVEETAKELVGSENPTGFDSDGVYKFNGPLGEASVYQDGSLDYKCSFPSSEEELNREDAIQLCEGFWSDRGGLPPDAYLAETIKKGLSRYIVVYHQSYLNVKIFASVIEMEVTPAGVERVHIYWLQPDGFRGEEQPLLRPAEALRRFAQVYPSCSKEGTISSVDYGYFSRPYKAQEWDLPPVWRVSLASGEFYYVNAFTGQLEESAEGVDIIDEKETVG